MSMTANEFVRTFGTFELDNKYYRASVEETNVEGDEYTAVKLLFTLYGIKISTPYKHGNWCNCKERHTPCHECHRGNTMILKFEKIKYDNEYVIKDYLT